MSDFYLSDCTPLNIMRSCVSNTQWRGLSFPDLAHAIMSQYIGEDEVPSADLKVLLQASTKNFRTAGTASNVVLSIAILFTYAYANLHTITHCLFFRARSSQATLLNSHFLLLLKCGLVAHSINYEKQM
jgi:Threonine synthase N terminus